VEALLEKRACPKLTPTTLKKKAKTSFFLSFFLIFSLKKQKTLFLLLSWHFLCIRTHQTTTKWIQASMWGTLLNKLRLWRESMLNVQSLVLWGDNNSSESVPSSPTLNPNRSKFGSKIAGIQHNLSQPKCQNLLFPFSLSQNLASLKGGKK